MLIDCNFRYLIVCGMVRVWMDGICKLPITEKWSKIKSEAETERTLHPRDKTMRSREWPWMRVGKSSYWWRSKEAKISHSRPASDKEESIRRLKFPIQIVRVCRYVGQNIFYLIEESSSRTRWGIDIEDNKAWLIIFKFARYSLKTFLGWQTNCCKCMGWRHTQAYSFPSPLCSRFVKERETLGGHISKICRGFFRGQLGLSDA